MADMHREGLNEGELTFENVATCASCKVNELSNDSRTLFCTHSFCGPCVGQFEVQGINKCPLCNTEIIFEMVSMNVQLSELCLRESNNEASFGVDFISARSEFEAYKGHNDAKRSEFDAIISRVNILKSERDELLLKNQKLERQLKDSNGRPRKPESMAPEEIEECIKSQLYAQMDRDKKAARDEIEQIQMAAREEIEQMRMVARDEIERIEKAARDEIEEIQKSSHKEIEQNEKLEKEEKEQIEKEKKEEIERIKMVASEERKEIKTETKEEIDRVMEMRRQRINFSNPKNTHIEAIMLELKLKTDRAAAFTRQQIDDASAEKERQIALLTSESAKKINRETSETWQKAKEYVDRQVARIWDDAKNYVESQENQYRAELKASYDRRMEQAMKMLCWNCGIYGHYKATCPQAEESCNICKMPGHSAWHCQNRIQCNACKIFGHVARECPN